MMMGKYKLLAFLLAVLFLMSCKDGENESGDSDDGLEAVATNTWLINSFADIDGYRNEKPANRAVLSLVRNEYESLQLVIAANSSESLSIEREGNEQALEFQCRKVEAFRNVNDVLVPCDGSITPASKEVKVWLTFKAKADAKSGTYKEIIRFRGNKYQYAVAIDVNIANASLPESALQTSVFGINPDNLILTGLTEEQKMEKRKEISDLLLNYRISPYFSTWLSGTMRTEVCSSPYKWDDERTWAYLKDKRFTRIALPYHGLTDNELKQMLDKAQVNGLIDKVYFYVWDEPTKIAEYAEIKDYAARIHRYAPKAKVLTTFYRGPEDGEQINNLFAVFDILDGTTDLFCTSTWALQDSEARAAQCKAKVKTGQEWWTYVCMSLYPGLAQNSSGIMNRVVMWRHWKEQADGFLYWVVNGFSKMIPLTPRPDLPEGDGILVYPGETFKCDKPCVSIRLERWRDGAEDYDMLEMMAKKAGRTVVEDLLNNVYKNPKQFTDKVSYMEAFKRKLVDAISE